MEVDKVIFPGLTNGTRMYSPITLGKHWSTLGRLVIMIFAACFGATLNGYYMTSFFIERDLYRIENVYHFCIGVTDMVVTSGVIPIAAVVLLSGVWDLYPVCQVLQTLTAASTYSYSILFAMVAVENYFRVCHFTQVNGSNMKTAVAFSAFMVFPFSIILAAFGTYWHLDYDYCERRYYGDPVFRHATSIVIHGTCFIITIMAMYACHKKIQLGNRVPTLYRRIHEHTGPLPNIIRVNIIAYILYVAAWTPYLIIVNLYPNIPDRIYYPCAWLGIGRSLLTSILYGTLGNIFGKAYTNIFYYCCCKSSLYDYFPPRSRRGAQHRNAGRAPELRTHIMQQAVYPNSLQRASSSTQETVEL